MNYTCLMCGHIFFLDDPERICPACYSTDIDLTENVARNEAINIADDIKEDKRLFEGEN